MVAERVIEAEECIETRDRFSYFEGPGRPGTRHFPDESSSRLHIHIDLDWKDEDAYLGVIVFFH